MADFLLEIGTEEIPARMIDAAQAELGQRIGDLLVRERLVETAAVESMSTPRRLAVLARDVRLAQADLEEELVGPSTSVAAKSPKAAEAFAKKAGVALSALRTLSTPKGEYLAARVVRPGRSAGAILGETIPRELSGIYWPKSMYWKSKSERFVRPVRWLLALLDGEIVPLEFAGIMAGAESRGHRELAGGTVAVTRAGGYTEALARACVLMPAERRYRIRKALDATTRTVPGARWREDADLLDTVVNLTEFPSVILGSIEREFLALPEEVLVTVMRDHQKYFAVEDAQGKLAPYFLAVLNTEGDPTGLIRHGNERVLRARFRDARFFWDTDQKSPLRRRVEQLKSVTFQKDLGNYYEKAQRMVRLCERLATVVEPAGLPLDRAALGEAALLAKTDLTAELVKEFTELQGVVGGLYAEAQGLGTAVAHAIYDHYQPASMEDSVPRTLEGALLAIADKADSVAGMFALGLQPTGSKDPFALRRQANGIVKTIAAHQLPLSLAALFQNALAGYAGSPAAARFAPEADVSATIQKFLRERLEFYLREGRGFAYDVVSAVLAAGGDDVVDVEARAGAVTDVRQSEDFAAISTAFKRMKNILRQAAESGKWRAETAAPAGVAANAGAEPAERELGQQAAATAQVVAQLAQQRQYVAALLEISKLRPAVDAFFDQVMVMVEDETVRDRRLNLLQALVREFSNIADFSEIVVGG
jgi:glycyl-tRNA synthetase beta chain